MSEISSAIEENLLDALRLKPVTDDETWLENYFGSIKGKDEEKIYIEIYEQSYVSFREKYKNQPFDIFFRFNRLVSDPNNQFNFVNHQGNASNVK